MNIKIDNNKALESVRRYLSSEADAADVVEALDDAYYLLAQHMASSIDNDMSDNIAAPNGKLHDAMYNIHRLREVLCE